MNILVSCFACSPLKGSEQAVGWGWINLLNKYNSLTVLVSDHYKDDIENYTKTNNVKNVKFKYIHFKRHEFLPYQFDYIKWQIKALKLSKRLTKENKFDLVHHVTFATILLPTFLYMLKLPLIIGPGGGGENIPKECHYRLGFKSFVIEFLRKISQFYFSHLSFNNYCMQKYASKILVTTEETKKIIRKKFTSKVEVMQTIGFNNLDFFVENKSHCDGINVLMAGRMLYWKAFDIGIRAFILAQESNLNINLCVVGDGKEMKYLKNKFSSYKNIVFCGKISRSDMIDKYRVADILVNTSLRDSGCLVVLEAMASKCGIITIDTGGPKILTDNSCAIKIYPKTENLLIRDIANSILLLCNSKKYLEIIQSNAYEKAKSYLYCEKAKLMQKIYNEVLNEK